MIATDIPGKGMVCLSPVSRLKTDQGRPTHVLSGQEEV